jgi:uncharacterized repeat protein (TIGR01451 family)
MLKVSFFIPLVFLLGLFGAAQAQEAFAPEQLYFQGEVIRKVSVGADGVWVIKGADSTGVARLDSGGGVRDYTSGLGFNEPLLGIVGKYGEHAFIHTKTNGIYSINEGSPNHLIISAIPANTAINHLSGLPNYTKISAGNGVYESYDDRNFYSFIEEHEGQFANKTFLISGRNDHYQIDTYIDEKSTCYGRALSLVFTPQFEEFFPFVQLEFDAKLLKGFNTVAATDSRSLFFVEYLIGDKSGLYIGARKCDNPTYLFLKDTAVYSLQNYKNLILTGTEHGLYYYTPTPAGQAFSGTVTKIDLGGDYKVYDIQVQKEEQIIWLATNKGLIKLRDDYQTISSYNNNSILWTKSLSGLNKHSVFTNAIKADAEGNIYQTGYFKGAVTFGSTLLQAQNSKDFYIAKLSPSGEPLWVRTAGYISEAAGMEFNEEGFRVDVDKEGHVYVACRLNNPSSVTYTFGEGIELENISGNANVILKYNGEGQLLWMKELSPIERYNTIQMGVSDLNYFYYSFGSEHDEDLMRWIVKLDSEGKQVWERQYTSQLDKFHIGRNGQFYLSGYFSHSLSVDAITLTSPSNANLALFQFDDTGEALWGAVAENHSWHNTNRIKTEIKADGEGNTYLAGSTNSIVKFGAFSMEPSHNAAYYFLAKLNAAGEYQWMRYTEGAPYSIGFKNLVVDDGGNSYITGHHEHATLNFGENTIEIDAAFDNKRIYVAKFDTYGENLWAHAIPQIAFKDYERMGSILSLTNHGILLASSLAGDIRINGNLLDLRGENGTFLTLIDKTHIPTPFTLLSGKAFLDLNGNNVFDEEDLPLAGNIIKAEPGPVYAKTDFLGNYQLRLGTGSYTLSQIIPRYPDKIITQTYPEPDYEVILTDWGQNKTGFDFAHRLDTISIKAPEVLAPEVFVPPNPPAILSIDFSSGIRQRCFHSFTYIRIKNKGEGYAENASVVVAYPEHILPLSSNPAWTKKEGNLLTFNIERIEANQFFYINIQDSVRCGDESIRGLEQCVKAYLNYTDPAKADPTWDQSDIELAAECKDNGFVRLTMRNSGTSHMADSALFHIFLDQEKVYTGIYKLAAGEELSLNVLANGKPLLFQAELSPHHPEKKSVSLQIEGCTTTAAPRISRSYETILPADTLHENQRIVCLPIVDSYDPNDKLAMPTGITDNHNIVGTEYLTYTIRFQNTGTAPAINIRIEDVLADELDLSTLLMGASSHPMQWERQGTKLIWRFTNIYLPDSTSNEPDSHGFVKFRIKPKPNLAKGTMIRNAADIYFDYNSPILTNEVFHTIGLPELIEAETLVIQVCDSPVLLEQAEEYSYLVCGSSSYPLSLSAPATGSGYWKVASGQGAFEDASSNQTTVHDLAYGANELVWEVTHCDQVVRHRVTLLREQPLAQPDVPQPAAYCQGDPLPTLHVNNPFEGLEWYADASLTQLLAQGASYQPAGHSSETYYVIQRSEHCSSPATAVPFQVYARPEPPHAEGAESCVALTTPTLTAQGNHIRWYADAEGQQLLAEGNSFSPANRSSARYYVTQSSEQCESLPVEVSFTAKHYDPDKAFIANVITPNEDDAQNRYFYLKPFETQECLGDFRSIRIFNRWGRTVFESRQADFRWDASQLPTGVYYYRMDWAEQKFQGTLQLIR